MSDLSLEGQLESESLLAMKPLGHGGMADAPSCSVSGRDGGVVPDSGWSPLLLSLLVTTPLPTPPSLSACEWHKSVSLYSCSHFFFLLSLLPFSRILSLAAENAHPLVCPNREVSLPQQTSLRIALFLYGICCIFSSFQHIKSGQRRNVEMCVKLYKTQGKYFTCL